MTTYWHVPGSSHSSSDAWIHFDGAKLMLLDEKSPPHVIATLHPTDDPQAWLAKWGRNGAAGTLATPPGEYHPRIWRPHKPAARDTEMQAWSASVAAARILFRRLGRVLTYIEPRTENLDAFGHELRILLIDACTEVESGWHGVLRENNYIAVRAKEDCWDRRDYEKLVGPMKLDQWEVSLVAAPAFGPIAPFKNWSGPGTLPWYDAYNAVKHFREENFQEAKLRHVISAVAGVYIMFRAQFGVWGGFETGNLELKYFADAHEVTLGGDEFRIAKEPAVVAGEVYMPPEFVRAYGWTKQPLFP